MESARRFKYECKMVEDHATLSWNFYFYARDVKTNELYFAKPVVLEIEEKSTEVSMQRCPTFSVSMDSFTPSVELLGQKPNEGLEIQKACHKSEVETLKAILMKMVSQGIYPSRSAEPQ